MRRKERTISIAFVIAGAILGSVLGEVLGAYYPFMRAGLHFGVPDFTLQLGFMELRLGFTLNMNIGTVGLALLFLFFSTLV
ncbi:hypothetical protein [Candidatus Cryosericum odellii]|uniref:DUF4321 domain-containing protein n=1 Tax=Candidatus Cryosericum odellii TaxID=2290917 RepID=A0A398D8C0_9BACT|nr:hypothetical protein [Candidatus Cryosericum odellii]RIE08658.1 hypothetical protein SMC6_03940 [Candidatus Cryosericum odellii]